jgi:hypothetical protein
MSKIAIISANLGSFDKPERHVKQDTFGDVDFIIVQEFNDKNFPPRKNSMTPRLQSRLVKMSSWQMLPDYDYYIWVDSSCRLPRKDSAEWFIKQLGDADMAFFKHPDRNTVQEEADYLKKRLAKNCPYITPRYERERLDAQMEVVTPEDQLYATTAFIYKNDTPARDMLTIWWLHTSMYHSIDQLSVTRAIEHSGAKVNMINEDYMNTPYLEFTRVKKKRK